MPDPEMRGVGFTSASSARPAGGDYYLFVIAIDDYDKADIVKKVGGQDVKQPNFKSLSNPVMDAADLTDILIDKYLFNADKTGSRILEGYPREVVEYNTIRTKCLYNENAIAANITGHLIELQSNLKPADKLVIYFAGHGDNNEINPSGCLIPFDGINKLTESNTWFAFTRLYSLFDYPRCLDLLIILDCCFAGKATMGTSTSVDKNFSRHVLVSSSPHETAVDGKEKQGSPFARALGYILKANSYGYASLNVDALKNRFENEYKAMFESKPSQEIIYRPLPTNCGYGDFIFELKDKDIPPPGLLTQTFVRHLNFSKEKKLLEDQFNKFNDADLNLIVTRESNKYVHELLRAVFFSELCQFDETSGCNMNLSVCLRKSLPLDIQSDCDIWTALIASFGAGLQPNPIPYAADTVLGQLLDKPMIISLYSNNLTREFSDRIIKFCNEFISQLKEAKQRRADAGAKDEVYYKLFFVIPDFRDKGDDFFKQDELLNLLGKQYNLFINTPVEILEKARTLKWFNEIKSIGSQNIQALKPQDFFPDNSHKYSILDFIYQVCDKVKVDKIQVESAILNY